jgi:catechol 2,3-dioxygenase-like lactoylglutathione lyase family enzyme
MMTIELNHTIVPARDKIASAKFFARIFGLAFDDTAVGVFAPVRVNETLTFDFDEADDFEIHHYAFHVSDPEFDAIFGRIKADGLPYGSEPFSREDMQINHRGGGRGVYFCDPNGHILELLTVG